MGTLCSLPQHPCDPLLAGRLGNVLQKHQYEFMPMCSNPKPASCDCSTQSPEDRKEEHKGNWWQGRCRVLSTAQVDLGGRWGEDASMESVTWHYNSNMCLGRLVTIWTSTPSLQPVGFRINAHWAVHCQATCSALLFPLQPPSPFLHKWTEKPFPSLIQQCAPAVWQRTCSAANFAAAAASICTSSEQCHLTQPGCRLPSRQCLQPGDAAEPEVESTSLPAPGEGDIERAKHSTFNSHGLPAAPGELVTLVCKAQGSRREQK